MLRLTPFLGFIYDSLDFFEVNRIFGFPDISVDLRIFGKVLADLFRFLARCTRIFGVIHPSHRTTFSEREKGKWQSKAKLAKTLEDFRQAL